MSAPKRPPARRVLGEILPHRNLAAKLFAAVAAGVLAGTGGPLIVAAAIDHGVVGHSMAWVLACALAYLAATGVQALTGYLQVNLAGRLTQDYLQALRRRLLDQLHALDLDFFARERSGRLVSRLTSDVDNLSQFFGTGLALVVQVALLLGLTTGILLYESPLLTGVIAVVLAPLVVASTWYRRHSFAAQLGVRERVSRMLTQLNETLVGIRVVQAFGVEEAQNKAFAAANADTYSAKLLTARVGLAYYPLIDLLYPVGLAAVLVGGAHLAHVGEFGLGTVVAFSLYVGRLFQPIQQIADLSTVLQTAASSFARVFAFEDEQPSVADAPDARPLQAGAGRIELEGLRFRYPRSGADVLHGTDLRIEAGERVALVGGSGSGKSTLVKLIARFYDPTDGRVLVDGQDVRTVTGSSLRRHLALVPQEGFLFDGTVADNIGLGRPGLSRDQIAGACEELGIAKVLAALPQGLDTAVTNRGLSLSAGQRQLVSLARAFLAEPRILILDEATSNLDLATEAVVEAAMARLLKGRTAILIAHRPATAMRADRVVVLEHGRVVEQGRPQELLLSAGAFAALAAASSAAA